MVHVNDKIARLEIGEITEEAGGFWAGAGALGGRRERFEEIGVAVDGEIHFGNHYTFADGRFDQDHAWNIAAVRLFGESAHSDVLFELAQAIGNFVLVTDISEAFEFASGSSRNHHLFAGGKLFADFGHERGDVAVVAGGGLSLQRALRRVLACNAEMFHSQARRELHCERPFFLIENEAIGRLADRAFKRLKGFPQFFAILFDGSLQEGRLVLDHERIVGEVEESGLAIFEQDLLKFPAGIKACGSFVIFAAGGCRNAQALQHFGAAGKFGERQQRGAFHRIR